MTSTNPHDAREPTGPLDLNIVERITGIPPEECDAIDEELDRLYGPIAPPSNPIYLMRKKAHEDLTRGEAE